MAKRKSSMTGVAFLFVVRRHFVLIFLLFCFWSCPEVNKWMFWPLKWKVRRHVREDRSSECSMTSSSGPFAAPTRFSNRFLSLASSCDFFFCGIHEAASWPVCVVCFYPFVLFDHCVCAVPKLQWCDDDGSIEMLDVLLFKFSIYYWVIH